MRDKTEAGCWLVEWWRRTKTDFVDHQPQSS